MTVRYRLSFILFCAALVSACAPANPGGDTQSVTTASTSTTGSSLSGSATGGAPGTSASEGTASVPTTTSPTGATSGPSSTGVVCDFLCDDYPKPECDPFAQDCPEGQKCAAVISDGGTWDAVKCVEVIGTDEPGEPCTMEDVASGVDSCIKGAMCWDVDAEGIGYCVALCIGNADRPACASGGACSISGDGTLNLCLQPCDPLLQDCPDVNTACYPINDYFGCYPTSPRSTGKANDPCQFIDECAAGLICAEAAVIGAGCLEGSTGCCTPFCKFPGGACPNPDQQCVQYFDPMTLPPDDPELEIGYCGVSG